jgi:AraC family transcriptional regulator
MNTPASASHWARSVRLGRYSPGAMSPHHHDDAWLCVVVAGRYEERIRGRTSQHGPGDMLFCPAFEQHAQQFHNRGAAVLIAPSPLAIVHLGESLCLADAPCTRSGAAADLGLRMAAELQQYDDFSALVMQGMVMEAVGRFQRPGDRPATTSLPWLREAKAFIEYCYSDSVTIDDVARVAGRHPVHVSRAFREAFGQTIGECVRSARVRHAARSLLASKQPIAEIAAECGFCDQAHLSRSFKKVFGITPGVYRTRLKQPKG